jgi:MFS family permease
MWPSMADAVRTAPRSSEAPREPGRVPHRRVIMASVMLAMFLTAMEISIVATATPSIVSKLGGFAELTWVFSAFLLAQSATIPIYGRLADLYGRRCVFAAGTCVFLVGSLLWLLASGVSTLLFGLLQGGVAWAWISVESLAFLGAAAGAAAAPAPAARS